MQRCSVPSLVWRLTVLIARALESFCKFYNWDTQQLCFQNSASNRHVNESWFSRRCSNRIDRRCDTFRWAAKIDLFIFFLESDVTIAVSKLQYTQQRCQTLTTVWKLTSTTSANQAVEINWRLTAGDVISRHKATHPIPPPSTNVYFYPANWLIAFIDFHYHISCRVREQIRRRHFALYCHRAKRRRTKKKWLRQTIAWGKQGKEQRQTFTTCEQLTVKQMSKQWWKTIPEFHATVAENVAFERLSIGWLMSGWMEDWMIFW